MDRVQVNIHRTRNLTAINDDYWASILDYDLSKNHRWYPKGLLDCNNNFESHKDVISTIIGARKREMYPK